MNKSFGIIIAVVATVASFHAKAADPETGKKLATGTCAACHGNNGIAIASIYPNLAGQKSDYLVAQLKAFRSGGRSNPIMAPMAKNLSDKDIDNLAAYFSGLKCQ